MVSQPFPILGFVVHSGQHFPYLRNRFERKLQDYIHSTLLWGQVPIMEIQSLTQNGRLVKPTSGMICCQTASFEFTSFMKILIHPFWGTKFNAKSESFGSATHNLKVTNIYLDSQSG